MALRSASATEDYSVATYSPSRRGAECPKCHAVAPRYKSSGWAGGTRVRYHRCLRCGNHFKSTEHDPTI